MAVSPVPYPQDFVADAGYGTLTIEQQNANYAWLTQEMANLEAMSGLWRPGGTGEFNAQLAELEAAAQTAEGSLWSRIGEVSGAAQDAFWANLPQDGSISTAGGEVYHTDPVSGQHTIVPDTTDSQIPSSGIYPDYGAAEPVFTDLPVGDPVPWQSPDSAEAPVGGSGSVTLDPFSGGSSNVMNALSQLFSQKGDVEQGGSRGFTPQSNYGGVSGGGGGGSRARLFGGIESFRDGNYQGSPLARAIGLTQRR